MDDEEFGAAVGSDVSRKTAWTRYYAVAEELRVLQLSYSAAEREFRYLVAVHEAANQVEVDLLALCGDRPTDEWDERDRAILAVRERLVEVLWQSEYPAVR